MGGQRLSASAARRFRCVLFLLRVRDILWPFENAALGGAAMVMSFLTYLNYCLAWLPAPWLLLVKVVFIFFLIWSLVRLISHILDAIPFL